MQTFIIEHVAELILGGIAAVLGVICKKLFAKLKEKEKDNEATKQGVIVALHMRLYELCQICIDKNFVTTEELRDAESVYDAYHSLGANGTGTALYHRILTLPIDNDRKED